MRSANVTGKLGTVLLWIGAFLSAAALGYFQRTTGPTYPMRGSAAVGGTEVAYKLLRTHGGDGGLEVRFGAPGIVGVGGSVEWRRYPSGEPWQTIQMVDEGDGSLVAVIPHQPPAGKVEYRLEISDEMGRQMVPAEGSVVARFRGDVPGSVLIPHILAMFGSMLLATRALLEVLRPGQRVPARVALGAMVLLALGGLVLGPVVQKYAFGAYWTGWPFGHDLTDNKTAIAVLAWLPATVLCLRRSRLARAAVVVGWVVMMGVFLIPHSLRGSEIDWSEHGSTPVTMERSP